MLKRIQLLEPQRGEKLLLRLNQEVAHHPILANTLPLASDIFVFFYPLYLVGLYLYGIYKAPNYREGSLFIFWSGWFAMAVNAIIKTIFTKTRPDVILDLAFENREGLVLEGIPANTFPSDHAAMAFAIATASLARGLKTKNKAFIRRSIPLYIMAIIMGIGRISIGIHRPTDILAGTIIGILVPFILLRKNIFGALSTYLIDPLILLQEMIWSKVFGYDSSKKS